MDVEIEDRLLFLTLVHVLFPQAVSVVRVFETARGVN